MNLLSLIPFAGIMAGLGVLGGCLVWKRWPQMRAWTRAPLTVPQPSLFILGAILLGSFLACVVVGAVVFVIVR